MSTPVREAIAWLKEYGSYEQDSNYGDVIRTLVEYAEAKLEDDPKPDYSAPVYTQHNANVARSATQGRPGF